MRKVIYSTMVSLDGFVEDQQRGLDWVRIDAELHSYINEQHHTIDTFLFGRRMYEVMRYWDAAEQDTSNPEYILEFARLWKTIHKIVYSQTLENVGVNAQLSRANIVDEIARLKEQPGRDLSVGGATLATTVSREGLIDEYQLFVQPVVLGGGMPMLQPVDRPIKLQLVDTHSFKSGVIMLRYRRTN